MALKGHHLIALLAGGGAMVGVLTTPVGFLEMLVTSAGVSEVLPAAAPPLGATARTLIAGFAGLMAAGIALAINRPEGTDQGEQKMGFAFSKLAALARVGRRQRPLADLPTLRRADAHPDAPPRRPIFASRDFGGADIFSGPVAPAGPVAIEDPGIEDEPIVDGAGLVMPHAPEPLDESELAALIEHAVPEPELRLARPEPVTPVAAVPASAAPVTALEHMSVAELARRFERGLARRAALTEVAEATERAEAAMIETRQDFPYSKNTVLADIPPVPPVAVPADVDPKMDEALRAALGTLRKMTVNGR